MQTYLDTERTRKYPNKHIRYIDQHVVFTIGLVPYTVQLSDQKCDKRVSDYMLSPRKTRYTFIDCIMAALSRIVIGLSSASACRPAFLFVVLYRRLNHDPSRVVLAGALGKTILSRAFRDTQRRTRAIKLNSFCGRTTAAERNDFIDSG